jgi:hypothetical protein
MNDSDIASLNLTIVWGAFALAFVFGFVAQRSNFCTMGAVSDIVNMGDWTRMRMWITAVAIAILGANGMAYLGIIDLSKSIYQTPNFNWLSYLVGGLCFGFGMTLASGCGSKTLLRIGGGSLKSVVVFLVLGIAAYMTLKGLFGVFRVTVLDPVRITMAGTQDLPSLLARAGLADKKTLQLVLGAAFGGGLLVFALKSREFRAAENLVPGLIIGLVIAGGWYLSGKVGYLPEHPKTLEEAFIATNSGRMESLSYVSPIAYTLEWFMFWSDTSKVATFGIASVFGLVLGSFVYSIATKTFRWEGFRDSEDTANHLVGGALMGFGGVTALGCTVGQGLTGVSTLALGSFLTLAAIIAGSWGAFRYQIWRLEKIA